MNPASVMSSPSGNGAQLTETDAADVIVMCQDEGSAKSQEQQWWQGQSFSGQDSAGSGDTDSWRVSNAASAMPSQFTACLHLL